ncbi:MAG: acyl-CoA dehydrogenase family protein [Pseudonocardia sp.]
MPSTSAPASPVEALFTDDPAVAEHPGVRTATRIAREVLAPHAEAADDPARGVTRAHLDLLAEHRLISATVPRDEGGLGANARVDAEIVEQLGWACGATWFMTTQHRFPQQLARGPLGGLDPASIVFGPAAERHRAGLSSSRVLGGIAIAHLRHRRPHSPRAEPAAGGAWHITGTAEWCTGWGLLELVTIAGFTADDRFVLALVPAAERPGLSAGPLLPLSVMGGTRTVALELDGLVVAPDEVLAVAEYPTWRAHDAARTANATPASMGFVRRVLTELHRLGTERELPEAQDLALALAERAAYCRREAYALLAEPMFDRVGERTALRAALTELGVRAAHALVAARSGTALLRTSPEQRWAREAAFHLIQTQTLRTRVAQLAAFGARP